MSNAEKVGENHADTLIKYYKRSRALTYLLFTFTIFVFIKIAFNVNFNFRRVTFNILLIQQVFSYIKLLDIGNLIDISYYINFGNSNIKLLDICIIFVGILVYTFIFELIRSKGALSFNDSLDINFIVQKAPVSLSSINSIYRNFSIYVVGILTLYLLDKGSYLELIFLIFVYLSYYLIIKTVKVTLNDNLFSYWALKSINEDKIETLSTKICNLFFKTFISYDSKHSQFNEAFIKIPRFQKMYLNYKSAIDKLKNNYPYKITKRYYLTYITMRIQGIIFSLSVIWIAIGVFCNFNILTIVITIFTFILWFFQISLFKHIPNSRCDILLYDHLEPIKGIYIIEDFPGNDYIVVKTDKHKSFESLRIMKSSIKAVLVTVNQNFDISTEEEQTKV